MVLLPGVLRISTSALARPGPPVGRQVSCPLLLEGRMLSAPLSPLGLSACLACLSAPAVSWRGPRRWQNLILPAAGETGAAEGRF